MAAACAALLVAACVAGRGVSAGREMSVEEDNIPQEDERGAKDVSVAVNDDRAEEASDFSLSVYSQEERLAGTQDGNLVFTDIGCGDGGYTGMLFQVKGDDIVEVSISLDKGELYTATTGELSEDVFYERMEQGLEDEDDSPDTHTVYQLIGTPAFAKEEDDQTPFRVITYDCTKCGAKVAGAYDEKQYYGFYIPDDTSSSETDLAAAYREQLGVFDDGTLTVTITRSDDSSASKEYSLSVAKLALDENRNVTQQEWIEGGEGFVYGILAKER